MIIYRIKSDCIDWLNIPTQNWNLEAAIDGKIEKKWNILQVLYETIAPLILITNGMKK